MGKTRQWQCLTCVWYSRFWGECKYEPILPPWFEAAIDWEIAAQNRGAEVREECKAYDRKEGGDATSTND